MTPGVQWLTCLEVELRSRFKPTRKPRRSAHMDGGQHTLHNTAKRTFRDRRRVEETTHRSRKTANTTREKAKKQRRYLALPPLGDLGSFEKRSNSARTRPQSAATRRHLPRQSTPTPEARDFVENDADFASKRGARRDSSQRKR